MKAKKEENKRGEKFSLWMDRVKEFIRKCKEKIFELKKKRYEKRYANGDVELPVFRIGPNKKGVALLWVLMGASLAFGVYKNFTAIDKETIRETKVVESEVKDTNAIEGFVERFAYIYHAWGNSNESKSEREAALINFMTAELVSVNNGVVNYECPTKAEVENVRICDVANIEDGNFKVRYLVVQHFTEAAQTSASVIKNELPIVSTGTETIEFEGTQTGETAEDIEVEDTENKVVKSQGQAVTISVETVQGENGTVTVTTRESFYEVVVHLDEDGGMVITKNPTTCGINGKSSYAPSERQSDGSVEASMMTEIEEFLNTFFALYPSATENEILYYAKPGVMDVINADYVYGGLKKAAYYKEDGKTKVHVYVQYLDQTAKMTQLSEYTLTLEKGDNWKIVEAE